ncbi:MAG: hypothetical protein R3332_05100 [Pseudohongiellaceae bacterium]|nr:hypothetical protein [Pseudohongiellaceae bacterium]
MAVAESTRLAYLQEMGIQTYFPRMPLPGAKASLGYSTQALTSARREAAASALQQLKGSGSAPTTSAPVSQVDNASVAAGLEQARALLEQGLDASEKQAKETPEGQPPAQKLEPKSVEEPVEPVAQPINFLFAYIAVSDQVSVVVELPWAGSGQMSADNKVLLSKILSAISVPCTPETIQPFNFRWPIEGMPDALAGHSARQMLEGFMARRLKLKPARFVLVFAEQSAQYLFPADFDMSATEQGMVSHPRLTSPILVTRSLDAMALSRQVKGLVWEALKPVKTLIEGDASSSSE